MTLSMRVELSGDFKMHERVSAAHRNTRPLMKAVGVLGMSSSVDRLTRQLKATDDATATGRLQSSITINGEGSGGTSDTVFELDDRRVVVGTNLPYAAQFHFGGTIFPKTAKALAIPLTAELKRSGFSPRDIDPAGEFLTFIPSKGGKPNIIGVLVDKGSAPTGRQRKRQAATRFGTGPLFALAKFVTQVARPFLGWSDQDERAIREELYPAHLGLR